MSVPVRLLLSLAALGCGTAALIVVVLLAERVL
jgi:hypothetical protein